MRWEQCGVAFVENFGDERAAETKQATRQKACLRLRQLSWTEQEWDSLKIGGLARGNGALR